MLHSSCRAVELTLSAALCTRFRWKTRCQTVISLQNGGIQLQSSAVSKPGLDIRSEPVSRKWSTRHQPDQLDTQCSPQHQSCCDHLAWLDQEEWNGTLCPEFHCCISYSTSPTCRTSSWQHLSTYIDSSFCYNCHGPPPLSLNNFLSSQDLQLTHLRQASMWMGWAAKREAPMPFSGAGQVSSKWILKESGVSIQANESKWSTAVALHIMLWLLFFCRIHPDHHLPVANTFAACHSAGYNKLVCVWILKLCRKQWLSSYVLSAFILLRGTNDQRHRRFTTRSPSSMTSSKAVKPNARSTAPERSSGCA